MGMSQIKVWYSRSLRADVTPGRLPFRREAKEIGDVCVHASVAGARSCNGIDEKLEKWKIGP